MSPNRSALIAIAIAVVVGTCACTDAPSTVVPAGAATTAYPGAPAPLPSGLADPFAGYATVVNGRLAIVLSGSSSCPPHADSADLATMTFGFSADTEGPCTADMAPTTFEFNLPSTENLPTFITINFTAGDTSSSQLPLLR
ncbi:hypothetical protein JF66_06755 [Cryobacterium sp. MLB-32]|uniref:hypothetical protein n=1 Tax=Cryobacterium sp. MLB-32 TaxID=1529318 RepID=UPI0004E63ED8|nr:hypothetical protein [Cryobacterium sp. MLB-32]KFF60105.1 hypothetical protein JF66_06755 [Cryobacterium sp. MLB-32]